MTQAELDALEDQACKRHGSRKLEHIRKCFPNLQDYLDYVRAVSPYRELDYASELSGLSPHQWGWESLRRSVAYLREHASHKRILATLPDRWQREIHLRYAVRTSDSEQEEWPSWDQIGPAEVWKLMDRDWLVAHEFGLWFMVEPSTSGRDFSDTFWLRRTYCSALSIGPYTRLGLVGFPGRVDDRYDPTEMIFKVDATDEAQETPQLEYIRQEMRRARKTLNLGPDRSPDSAEDWSLHPRRLWAFDLRYAWGLPWEEIADCLHPDAAGDPKKNAQVALKGYFDYIHGNHKSLLRRAFSKSLPKRV